MSDTKTRTVAAIIFDDVEPLDLFGPVQAFKAACLQCEEDSEINLYKLFTIAKTKDPVDIGGVNILPEYSFGDIDRLEFDILLIPGGLGTRELVNDREFILALNILCEKAEIIASVCTGAGLLAKTGRLDGKRATSNKKAWAWVIEQGPNVRWDCPKRWVDLIDSDGIITSAGVSAGTDMSIALIEKLNGQQVVKDLL